MKSSAHHPSITTVFLASLGCARNQIDSEVMMGRLKNAGFHLCDDPQDAEAIVVNTCSFIESAADESIETILELAKFKTEGRCKRLIVAGCLPQRYGGDIAAALPEVDYFIGTGAFDRIAAAVGDTGLSSNCLLPDPDAIAQSSGDLQREKPPGPMAYLKIAEGCNRHCTYCIIPKLRGRQKSRPPDQILAEARSLVAAGVKELVLVAQESTAYGSDLNPPHHLAHLLDMLADLKALPSRGAGKCHRAEPVWIRFLYGHPQSLDIETIKTVARHSNLCSYFDIPIQHIGNRVLKQMGRRYSRSDVLQLVDTIRQTIPDAVLRTTLITGFPGETETDFNELLTFVTDVEFDHLGCFVYSDAEDLPSHRFGKPVAEQTAQKRYEMIMEAQKAISVRRIRQYLNRVVPVLIEDVLEPNVYAGRTQWQAPEVDGLTIVHAEAPLKECFAEVKIIDTLEYDLVGEIE